MNRAVWIALTLNDTPKLAFHGTERAANTFAEAWIKTYDMLHGPDAYVDTEGVMCIVALA